MSAGDAMTHPQAAALNARLTALSSAEEFFELLAVPFDRHVLDVSRLHVLKRYRQYLDRVGDLEALDAAALLATHRELLARAHGDFVDSRGVDARLFKVFRQAEGRQHVALETLRARLPSQR